MLNNTTGEDVVVLYAELEGQEHIIAKVQINDNIDLGLTYFVTFTGITVITLLIQFIYYYSNWKKSFK